MISVSAGYGTDGSSTPTIVAVRVSEPDRLADDRRIALERRRPEAVRQHRRARRLRPVVAGVEQAAEHRPQAHDLEVRAADDAGADHARLAEADHREADGGEVAEGGQRLDARAQVVDLRDRERGVLGADARRALADVDQPILVAVDERPQQHAADDAEDGGVGADAERQRQDDGDGRPLTREQGSQRKPEVGEQAHGASIRTHSSCSRMGRGRIDMPRGVVGGNEIIDGPGRDAGSRLAHGRNGGTA